MSKDDRTTVRLGEENRTWVDGKDGLNLSDLVRSMLTYYRTSGDAEKSALLVRLHDRQDELGELRRQQVELQGRIEEKERKVENLQARLKRREESVPERVIQLAENVKAGRFPEERLKPTDSAVVDLAGKAGLTPGRFVEEVLARL